MAAVDSQKLLLTIDANVEILRRRMADGSQHIAKFETDTKRHLGNIDRSFAGLGKGANAATKTFSVMRASLAALGISVGVAAITSMVKSSFDLAASLGETSRQLGVSTKALQLWRYIGDQAGVSQEQVDKGLAKLNRTLGDAAKGAAAPTKALQTLGFSLVEIRKGLTVDEVLPRLQERLSNVGSSSKRAAELVLYFGRAGQAWETMLGPGSAKVNEMADAAERLGLILSDEQIRRLDEAADKMSELKKILSANVASVVAENTDSIIAFTRALLELIGTAGRAALYLRNFWLATEASNLERLPAQGRRFGAKLSPEQEMSRRQRLSDIAEEQLHISRTLDPEYQAEQTAGRQRNGFWKPLLDPLSVTTRRPARPRVSLDDLVDAPAGGTPKVTAGDVGAILRRNFGGTITSATRSGAGNRAAGGAANSYHKIGQAVDFVPRGGMGALTKGQIREALEAEGIDIKELLGPGDKDHKDHFHVAFGRGKATGEQLIEQRQRSEKQAADDAQRAAEEAERKRKEALRNEFESDSELRQAKARILQAMQDLEPDYQKRAELSLRQLDLEKEQELAAIALAVKLKDKNEAEAVQARLYVETEDALRREKVARDTIAQRAEERADLEAQAADHQRRLLEGQADLATTAAQRRRIALRLLELDYREEQDRLKTIRDNPNLEPGDRNKATDAIGQLDERHSQNVARAKEQTLSPLEAWRKAVPKTVDEINEELGRIEAEGLQSLTDGITDAIMGTKSLGEVFKSVARQIIAELVKIAVKRAVLAGLDAAMGGNGSSSGGGGDEAASFFASIGKMLGGSRAIGGEVSPNRIYRVHKDELFRPRVPGTIIPANALGKGGAPAPPQQVEVFVTASEDFEIKVATTAGAMVQAAEPGIAARASARTVSALFRSPLPSGLG